MSRGENPFPEPLHFDNAGIIGGRRCIVITQPFPRVTSEGIDWVPPGFISDGASIPRLAQGIIGNPFDAYLEDAVHHDYDYSPRGRRGRGEADFLMKGTMWNRDFPLAKILAFYTALRLGGWRHFKGQPWR